jgi:hypothetical protein
MARWNHCRIVPGRAPSLSARDEFLPRDLTLLHAADVGHDEIESLCRARHGRRDSLAEGFGALLQIIDRKNNKSNAAAIALQMARNRPDEFCVVGISWSDGDFKHLRPPAKRSVSATTAIKANATVRKKKPEV